MLTLTNVFILLLAVGAAALGVSALVEKRHVRRRRDEDSSSNIAA